MTIADRILPLLAGVYKKANFEYRIMNVE